MSAYKDEKRGTWYVKVRYTDWTNETKQITKRGFATKREALQWEREFLLEKTGSLDMTFKDFVPMYLQNRIPRLKASTCLMKANIIDTKITPYFGGKKVRDITSADVMQWQNAMLRHRDDTTGEPYSKSYLKTLHNQLSAIFNHAVKFYGLKENPARVVGNMGSDKGTEMQFWTKDEYLLFAEEMMEDPKAYYAFETLYWTGIRLGELLALEVQDIDFKKRTMRISKTYQRIHGEDVITDPKTPKSKRVIKLPAFLCDELEDYINMQYDLQLSDRLFPITKSYLHHKLRSGCEKIGAKKIRIHDLRHSHVSLLISLGYSAVAIADRMGHESIDITYRYAHLFPSTQDAMAETLDKLREE